MSMDKPFRVEVEVDAPRDVVWRELTEPERIRHWFGWEYDGLDDEIRFIFVEHARPVPPDRIELVQDGVTELIPLGDRTLIRVVKPGDLDAAEWKDVYGDIEEGWITFLHQLRYRLARGGRTRRMLVLTGSAVPSSAQLDGTPWHESRYQRGVEADGSLVVVGFKAPLSSDEPSDGMLLVTTYDLSDEQFAAVERRWTSWWDELVRN
jgi:hypothetical protein